MPFTLPPSRNEIMELLTPKLEKGYYLPPEAPGFGVDFTDSVDGEET